MAAPPTAAPPAAVPLTGAVQHDRRQRSRRPHPATVVLVLLVTVLTAWHAREASQHLLTDRDPGVYVTAGRWLAREGSLLVEPAPGPFAGRSDLEFEEQGWHEAPDGRLEPQFLHLLPVILAGAHLVGGDRLLLVAPALVAGGALLALAAFARRVVGRWWAVAVTAAVALTLPWVHLSRDAFSEPLAVGLLFAGLAVLWDAEDGRRWWRGPVAGLLLGAVATARVEGFVILLPLLAVAALAFAGSRRHAEGHDGRVVVGGALGLVIGASAAVVDLRYAGSWYLDDLRGLLTLVAVGVAAVAVIGAVAAVRPPRRRLGAGGRDRLGVALATVAVLAIAGAWFVRPAVSEVTGAPAPAIAAIEADEGRAPDGERRYSEESVHWLVWYQGPLALALATAGTGLALRRAATGGGGGEGRRLIPFLAVVATLSALYLWRPSIVPDHIWVMRRYAVATIPGVAVLAALAAREATSQLRRSGRDALAALAAGSVATILVGVPLSTVLPVRGTTTQEGLLQRVLAVCDTLDGSAALVAPGGGAELTLAQTLRSFCGVPVAIAGPGLAATDVDELAGAWAEDGRGLGVVGFDAAAVTAVAGAPPVLDVGIPNDELVERTLTRRPAAHEALPVRLVVAIVAP